MTSTNDSILFTNLTRTYCGATAGLSAYASFNLRHLLPVMRVRGLRKLEVYAQSRSQPTTSANKMAAERVVWYLWANFLVLAIANNSGQSDRCMVTCLPKSRAKPVATSLKLHSVQFSVTDDRRLGGDTHVYEGRRF